MRSWPPRCPTPAASGVLGMGAQLAAPIGAEILRARQLTTRPFGVNLLLPFFDEDQFETRLDDLVFALVLCWGDPPP